MARKPPKNAYKMPMGFSVLVYYETGISCESSWDNVCIICVLIL